MRTKNKCSTILLLGNMIGIPAAAQTTASCVQPLNSLNSQALLAIADRCYATDSLIGPLDQGVQIGLPCVVFDANGVPHQGVAGEAEKITSADHIVFARPTARTIRLEPQDQSEGIRSSDVISLGAWPTCSAPIRHYAYSVRIDIASKKAQKNKPVLIDQATIKVQRAFTSAARDVLLTRTDTTAVGWQDTIDTVCRSHQNKASLVLPAPYFENVEYCMALIENPPESDLLSLVSDRLSRSFRIRAEASVSITKNPTSPYRDPTKDEILPYGETLVSMTAAIRSRLSESTMRAGWNVVESAEGLTIVGFSK